MVTIASLIALATAVSSAGDNCINRVTIPTAVSSEKRGITASDLIELRDFGPQGDFPGGTSNFSLSPDRRTAAFMLRRADVATNNYCQAIVLLDIESGASRILDVGGEPILGRYDFRGMADVISGVIDVPLIKWSPDGRTIAYLKRVDDRTQIWTADVEFGGAKQLTESEVDVRRFQWLGVGEGIVFELRDSLLKARAQIDDEGLSGFLYDRRFWPISEAKPAAPSSSPRHYYVAALDGATRAASESERGLLSALNGFGVVDRASLYARGHEGREAWVAAREPSKYLGPTWLGAKIGDQTFRCEGDPCADRIIGIWWQEDGSLLFLRDWFAEGLGDLEFFSWSPGSAPQSLFRTRDVLTGCLMRRKELLCGRENAEQPREIVLVDPVRQSVRTVLDPNPEFSSIRLGNVVRIPAEAGDGARSFADFVLPPDHREGEKHPLVIVQYNTRGFLRGGTGDEYPIRLFAQNGFAVLAYQRPQSVGFGSDARSINAFQRINVGGWADRRRAFEALDDAVDKAIKLGVVDPSRIGITGVSDGASTVQWALINSNRYRVAAISHCCQDPSSTQFLAGPAFAEDAAAWGYPPSSTLSSTFWQPYSLVANVNKIAAPILAQVSDREYRASLETWSGFDRVGKPFEMYVYPDEYHVKWQPAHRQAIYVRAVDWFKFWLQGKEKDDPVSPGQYKRWRSMRAKQCERRGSNAPERWYCTGKSVKLELLH